MLYFLYYFSAFSISSGVLIFSFGASCFYYCSRIISVGDLNCGVDLSYEETKALLEDKDWDTLLEKDQVCF